MKYLFALLLFLPITVQAQSLGCAIEFSNPSVCSTAHVNCASDKFQNVGLYGETIADLCEREKVNGAGWDSCINDLSTAVASHANITAHWKACGDTNDQIRGAIGFWEGLTHYYEGLTARLRAKCGKKCRGLQ